MKHDGLFIGSARDGGADVLLDADHLTTHAVCLGMTGSGKTGLGIVTLEELARRRVPLLVIDLKGDMLNLLLNFPELRPEDFEPWLSPDLAARDDLGSAAADQAALWAKGLARNGLTGSDIAAVQSGLNWQIVTPGVAAGAPLDIIPSLSVQEGLEPDADPDGARDRVNGLTSALLSLVDRGGDPLSDPDHVLVASVILHHWSHGEPLDLPRLLASIADPPIDHLGALPLDTFYPRDRRMKLVMALNTLIASPSFAAWTRGLPLDMEHLLGSPDHPRGTVVTLAHLDDRQRQFCLALIVSELVAWMRRQPASSGLRALLYIDEVQGILPPHPANPPTKGPLLTLLKQGRAFGIGAWLATQNPVDLDYKALGNAGVKIIGRLITERDRERALEGLGLDGTDDGRRIEQQVTGLGKREFLLHDVRAEPRLRDFSSRWAMSYLRGPITLGELGPLLEQQSAPGPADASSEKPPTDEPPRRADSTREGRTAPPVLAIELPQVFADRPGFLHPALVVRNRVTVERRTLNLLRTVDEHWIIPFDQDGILRWDDAESSETPFNFLEDPAPNARFPISAPEGLRGELRTVDRAFVKWRAHRGLTVLANPELKCVADRDENREAFHDRCLLLADRADDRRQETVRERYEKKIETIGRRLEREQDELDRDEANLDARRAEEKLGMVEGLFSVLLGSRSLRTAAGKATSKLRSTAGKRRMRRNAEASVQESLNEIQRLEDQLDNLAEDMEAEIAKIAGLSEAKAADIEELEIRPKQANVRVVDLAIVWR